MKTADLVHPDDFERDGERHSLGLMGASAPTDSEGTGIVTKTVLATIL
jgi:hypothetical protein